MLARLWRTRIDEGQAEAYEAFARDISLPMFHAQPGYEGALMLRAGEECTVITLWRDEASIASLKNSPSYGETVSAILATGFIRGEQCLELMDVHLVDIAGTGIYSGDRGGASIINSKP